MYLKSAACLKSSNRFFIQILQCQFQYWACCLCLNYIVFKLINNDFILLLFKLHRVLTKNGPYVWFVFMFLFLIISLINCAIVINLSVSFSCFNSVLNENTIIVKVRFSYYYVTCHLLYLWIFVRWKLKSLNVLTGYALFYIELPPGHWVDNCFAFNNVNYNYKYMKAIDYEEWLWHLILLKRKFWC